MLKEVVLVAYRKALPLGILRVYLIFHVSIFKKYHGDGDYIHWDPELFDKKLSYKYELIAILDTDIRNLKA